MNSQEEITRRWLLIAIVCGLGCGLSYGLAMFAPFPLETSYMIMMTFGPLLCASSLATYQFLRVHGDSAKLQIGTLLVIVAGGINTLMIAMQASLNLHFSNLPQGEVAGDVLSVAWQRSWESGNALQLGADLAWDIFVFTGMILWGLVLVKHPRFGHFVGWSGVAVGLLAIVINAWTYPTPPAEAGLFDIGPIMGTWFLLLSAYMIRFYWATGKRASAKE